MAREKLKPQGTSPVEVVAPGVIARQSVDQPVQIGLKAVDANGAYWSRPKGADHRRQTNR